MAIGLGDVMQISWKGRFAGQRIILTHTLECVIAPSTARTPSQIMGSMVAKLNPLLVPHVITSEYLACLGVNYSLEEIRAQIIAPIRYRWQAVSGTLGNGSNLGTNSTGQLAGVLTFWTALSGRAQVANKHIGPLPDEASSAGVLKVDTLNKLLALRAALAEPINLVPTQDGSWQPGIYHAKKVPPQDNFDQWVSSTTQTTTRVMRRRTVGVGE